MIGILISAIKIIFLLGFLIFIHEGGHFLVAKLCKVKVNEFAIGFGPTIWKKQGNETKYALRLIPLGGFVSMEGEVESSEQEGSFSKASIPRRIAIVAAGALVNIVFGLIVYFILMSSTGNYVTNVIDSTVDNYAAQQVGIKQGDAIVEFNGNKVKNKYDLNKLMNNNNGEEIKLKINRNDQIVEYTVKPTKQDIKSTGIYLKKDSKIIAVEPNSSAEKAGLKANDKIIKINGENTNNDPYKVLELINSNAEILNLEIERDKETLNIDLTPDYTSKYYLGVTFKQAENTLLNHIYYGLIETKTFGFSILENLKQLFSGNVSVDQMMGPVGISEAVAETNGFSEFIYLLALISLSLGVTNLLPIPALDGGKIVILLIEAIRKKPLKEGTEMKIQLIGFSILISLTIYITYNDILKIF